LTAIAWVLALGIIAYLLIVHTRRALILLGIVAALVAVAGGFLFGQAWISERRSAKQLENMRATATYDLSRCSESHPILIAIGNGNDRDVTYTTFDYSGYREGYSGALYDAGYGQVSSDFIIAAGQVATSCWTVPRAEYNVGQATLDANPPTSLRWEAGVRSVRLAE
jgi:hypothetical protein